MNIGFFTDTYLPQINGVVTSIEIFRKELIKKGHTVFVYGPHLYRGENMAFDQANHVYRFYSIPYFRQKEHRIVFPFSHKFWNFRKYKLDIIHTHTYFPMGIYAAYLGKRYRIPLVHTYHTLWAEYAHYSFLPRASSRKALMWGSKVYCNLCDLIISPSEAIKDVLNFYGVTKPIKVLPTGIETDIIRNKADFDVRTQFKIKPGLKILCFIGRFGREKNLYFLLRAFKLIQQYIQDCVLLMVGDGPEMKGLTAYSRELGISGKIIFTGYLEREKVMSALFSATLFLSTSETETQGLSIIEAMTAGVPAVVVDAMGVAETVAGNVGGLLAKADENDFASKVIMILSDKKLYDEKAKETVLVKRKFSASNNASLLVENYEKLLSVKRLAGN